MSTSIIKFENSKADSEYFDNAEFSWENSESIENPVLYDWLDDLEKKLKTEDYLNSNIDTTSFPPVKFHLPNCSFTNPFLYQGKLKQFPTDPFYFYKTEKNAAELSYEEYFEQIISSLEKSAAIEEKWKFLNKISSVLFDLDRIFRECSVKNWDGYGAKPLIREAYFEVVQFLYTLPLETSLPEISPQPTGEIGLEWRKGDQAIFLLSFSGEKLITYAGVFGPKGRFHGIEGIENSEEGEYKLIFNCLKFFD